MTELIKGRSHFVHALMEAEQGTHKHDQTKIGETEYCAWEKRSFVRDSGGSMTRKKSAGSGPPLIDRGGLGMLVH